LRSAIRMKKDNSTQIALDRDLSMGY
jgi:hypothetical protein